jgi:hypothetical protein
MSDGRPFALGNVPLAAFPIVWWAVGASIVVRAAGHRVGRLLTVVGVLAGGLVGGAGFVEHPGLPAAAWAILLDSAVYGPLFVALILASMVLFPDGRLPTPAWRLPVLFPISMALVATLAFVLRAGPVAPGLPDNPVGIEALPAGLLAAMFPLDPIGIALLGAVGAASLAWRFRQGNPKVRAQLKWLLASVIPTVILTPIGFLEAGPYTSNLAGSLSILGLLLIPISIGVAITRYRLFEIDRLISRGLSWAALSGLLVAVYAGGIIVLQSALAGVTQDQTLAVAASTLLAAALFQPLRVRLQRAMDRRFDRARYDGEQVVAAFNDRLHDQIDLDALATEIGRVAGETVRPASAAVWIRPSVPSVSIGEVS